MRVLSQDKNRLEALAEGSFPGGAIPGATIVSQYIQRNAIQLQAIWLFGPRIQAMLQGFGSVYIQKGFQVSDVLIRHWDESAEAPYRDIESAWWRLNGQLPTPADEYPAYANILVSMYFYRRAGQRCFVLQGVDLPEVNRIETLRDLFWALPTAFIEAIFAAIDDYRRRGSFALWRVVKNAMRLTIRNFQILRCSLTLNQLSDILSQSVAIPFP